MDMDPNEEPKPSGSHAGGGEGGAPSSSSGDQAAADVNGQEASPPVIRFKAKPVHATKEWQQALPLGQRDKLIRKFVEAIFPSDPDDPRTANIEAYAKKVEADFFAQADSQSVYFRLLAETIYDFQMRMAEKRRIKILEQSEAAREAAIAARRRGGPPTPDKSR